MLLREIPVEPALQVCVPTTLVMLSEMFGRIRQLAESRTGRPEATASHTDKVRNTRRQRCSTPKMLGICGV